MYFGKILKIKYDKVKFGSESDLKTVSIKDKYKIRFDSNTDLPLNTPMVFHALTIVIRCVIEKSSKFYPQVYLEDALFEDNL